MAILTVGVGSGFDYASLADAIAASRDGDVIKVQAGTYTNDFATISTSITIEGVGGMVNLVATEPPPNQKGILTIGAGGVTGPEVTIDNVSFSGAAIPNDAGGNAAGIRYQSGNLVLNNCSFFDNQNGLLADADPGGAITINRSEFASNGNADPPPSGVEHNLYVGAIRKLTIDDSYFHDAIVGHEIKSRAANTTITNSRIGDPNGTGSYEIDLPNGGDAVIENNVVEKGAGAQNSRFIAFGEEGNLHAGSSLSVTRNSLINDYGHGATAIWNATAVEASVTANTAYGLTDSQLVSGPVMSSGSNTLLPLSSEPAPDTSAPYLPVLPFSFACFAAGTRLLTAEGEVPVEALRVGQLVVGLTPGEGGKRALRPIRWIGHRHIDISRHADPGAVRPIRIRSGAFADGVPARDLLMSPDHAILVDGLLIPVRLLQNGASILSDNRITAVRYFHVELDRHAILLAEGLAAESYLDTGNRGAFENADAPLLLHPDFLTDTGRTRSTQDDAQAWRETLSCAPFAADAMRVEPVWRRLAVRATLLGYRLAELATTSDPGFRLLVDRRPHWPVARQDGRYVFVLPRPVPSVRLVSRAAAPCTLTPWIEDRRRLGVAVGRMILVSAQGVTLEIPVDHPTLTDGWWMVERDHALLWRWTAGSAVLPLPGGIAILQIGLVGGALYPLAEQTEVAAARPMVA